tara:strand:+ start:4023 stop:4379 length:357 start_codon:yes stop_codon:yes gene_type:complete
MGFFSFECRGCGESLKAPYDIPEIIEWQNDVVAITAEGENLAGTYDGYGRIARVTNGEVISTSIRKPAECWHKWCWEESGSPDTFTKASGNADDQGFFYDKTEPVRSHRGLPNISTHP